MVTFRAICCIHYSFGWMVISAGGELTADFRLRFGNPARDAERQAASHHREHPRGGKLRSQKRKRLRSPMNGHPTSPVIISDDHVG